MHLVYLLISLNTNKLNPYVIDLRVNKDDLGRIYQENDLTLQLELLFPQILT